MTTTKTFPGSHQQTNFLNTVQVAAHYTAHIGIAPSILVDRKSPEVSLLKICIIALCNCFTFCQTFIAPSSYKNLPYLYRKADSSWRVRIVAPHIPHVLYAFVYKIVKVHLQAHACILDKINFGLISPKST